jgi:hypothetical protein
MLAPLVGTEQLQKKPEDLRVRWASDTGLGLFVECGCLADRFLDGR